MMRHQLWLCALCLFGFQTQSLAGNALISDAWVRQGPPGMPMMAGFFTLSNPSEHAITVTGISSPDFDSVEMHETLIENGTAKMRPLKVLLIPPHTTIELKPGGKHLMLFDPHTTLKIGEEITLNLKSSEGCIQSKAVVLRSNP